MRISDWSSDVCSSDLRRLVLSDRRQQRTLQQELLGEDVLLHCFGALAAALARFDGEQLTLVVPLVNRRVGVEALVALQADQPSVVDLRQRLGDLGLADAGSAFQQDRTRQAFHRSEEHTSELQSLMRI